jgi:transposase-like protein
MKHHRPTKAQIAWTIEMLDQGFSIYALAKELGCSQRTLNTWVDNARRYGFAAWDRARCCRPLPSRAHTAMIAPYSRAGML